MTDDIVNFQPCISDCIVKLVFYKIWVIWFLLFKLYWNYLINIYNSGSVMIIIDSKGIELSVAKATLQSQMSVHPFICLSSKPPSTLILHLSTFFLHLSTFILHLSTFIIHLSTFILHFTTFKLFSLFSLLLGLK